jgi:cytochrome c-type biogenesis protein CcmH/NrfF
MRQRVLAALLVATAVALPASSALASTPRPSLTDIEQDLMCVVCKTPLAASQAPEADRERALITQLIDKGLTKPQIEHQMVIQYGPSILALPPASGFNLTVYVLPPALVLTGAALLAYTLPKWRRRTRAAAADPGAPPPEELAPSDSRRLDDELARFGR